MWQNLRLLERKRRLLSSARCLLAPGAVPDASNLVGIEALACGTPVVAFRSGALASIVEHGKTGFLVNTECEMADAIHEARGLRPDVCRETARERFSSGRMIEQYFAVYERLAADTRAAETAPGAKEPSPAT